MMVRLVAGARVADKLVPNALVHIPPPIQLPAKPKELIVQRNIIIRAPVDRPNRRS